MEVKCPYCGSTQLSKSGHTAIGTQRYVCKVCGKKSAGDRTVVRLKHTNHGITCPICGSGNLKKSGKSHKEHNCGIRFTCLDCGKKFTMYRKLTDEQKKAINLYCIQIGRPVTEVAHYLKISRVQVRRYIKLIQQKETSNEYKRTNFRHT